MSKKECKRVPSYAIRHLIQSLKEKGRTCRKGAEQRIDREILICDPEEEYVRRLAEALLLKKEVTAGVRICSSPEMVQELLKIGLIKVLLISEDVPYEKRKQIFTGKRIILTRQHCVDLTESTIKANARFFESMDEVPKQAYTMGIKNIMAAKKILLMATGTSKAEALYNSLYGPITPNVPASILQLHPDVTVVADEEALSIIREKGLL